MSCVATAGSAQGQENFVCSRQTGAVYELVDQQMIADEQRILHGSRGYFKSLHTEGPDHEGQQNSGQARIHTPSRKAGVVTLPVELTIPAERIVFVEELGGAR